VRTGGGRRRIENAYRGELALLRKYRGTTVARRAIIGAALLVPVLAGCEAGYNAPTQEFHEAAAGAYSTPSASSGITINNAFVLGPATGATLPTGSSAGLFLALYNSSASGDTLVSASAPGTASSITLRKGPVSVSPSSSVLLTGPEPELVLNGLTRSLTGGQTVQITLTFANAGKVLLEVPVEPDAFYNDALSPPASPSPSATATATASATASSSPSASPSATG
jgi:copper(I)-binding protein